MINPWVNVEIKTRKPKTLTKIFITPDVKIHPVIFCGCGGHLGDRWKIASRLLNESRKTNSKIRFVEPEIDRYSDIIPLFDIECPGIIFISKDHSDFKTLDIMPKRGCNPKFIGIKKGGIEPFYVPTKIRWSGGRKNRICYQFDGNWRARKKNPPKEDISRLVDFIPNIDFIRLGNHLSIEECIRLLANSDCFLGVDSGMSHIAHSVGVPCFLIKYNMSFDGFHHGAKYEVCDGTDDAIRKVKLFMGI